jgi:hypothetical protein
VSLRIEPEDVPVYRFPAASIASADGVRFATVNGELLLLAGTASIAEVSATSTFPAASVSAMLGAIAGVEIVV